MWTGLKVKSYILDNSDIKKVLADLVKTHSVATREQEGQTMAFIGGQGYFFIKKMKGQSIVSVPYHSLMSMNSTLFVFLAVLLLIDFTVVGGLVFAGVALLLAYIQYDRYERRRKAMMEVIEKYAKN